MSHAPSHTRFYAAVAVSTIAVIVVILAFPPGGSTAAYSSAPPEPPIPCAEGLTSAGGGCLALPAHVQKGMPLLIYLHGLYSPVTEAEELLRQARVAKLGVAKGFAVLAVRGLQGECMNEAIPDTYCWPSNARNEMDGAVFVARWKAALSEAEHHLGPRGRRYLLGFSNGGYFATVIATRALHQFDAITIAHAGAVPPTKASGKKPPLLLLTSDDDPSDPEMVSLSAELRREHWPHAVVAREGGHELTEWDVNVALTFFQRVDGDKAPFAPPLGRTRTIPTTTTTTSTSTSTSTATPTSPSASTEPSAPPSPSTSTSPSPSTSPAASSDE